METFHDMLFRRHSIRRYTDQLIDGDDVKLILEAALLAPSSKSARPWHFVVVEDRETLEALSGCKKFGTAPLKRAALAVVVCADPGKSDVYIEDATYAAALMQLQAEALGLGSCWVQVRGREGVNCEWAEETVQNMLGIPQYIKVECIITFGYKDEQRREVDPSKLLWEKVHIGTWQERDGQE